jgi:integrase
VHNTAGVPSNIDWGHWLSIRTQHLAQHPEFPKYLLLPQIAQLIDAMDDHYYRALTDFIWHTGARISEAQRLRKIDLVVRPEVGEGYVVLQAAKVRRGPQTEADKKLRHVPVTDPEFINDFTLFLNNVPGRAREPVFVRSNQAYHKALQLAATRAGLDGQISAHTLRHSYAINALLNGTPINVIQQWLGHASLSTTLVYLSILSYDTMHFAKQIRYR